MCLRLLRVSLGRSGHKCCAFCPSLNYTTPSLPADGCTHLFAVCTLHGADTFYKGSMRYSLNKKGFISEPVDL